MVIEVRCADCGMDYNRTVLNTNGCPNCGSKDEAVFSSNNYNSNDYITLNETEEEKLLFKKYIEFVKKFFEEETGKLSSL